MDARPLPRFRYHPDPVATGAITHSDDVCACCGEATGFAYDGPLYADDEPDGAVCPWCIADGRAAARWDMEFTDPRPLAKAGVPGAVIEDVTRRTPGFTAWQQEEWLCHCGDACEFHGDASVDDVRGASAMTRSAWCAMYALGEDQWAVHAGAYVPGGDVGFYRFRCRHCGLTLLGWDCA